MTAKPDVSLADVEDFLAEFHGTPVTAVEALEGGWWTAAFGYEHEDRRLVFRVCRFADGFEADRAFAVHASDDVPIPRVLHVGEGLGHHVAVSERHDGRFLELIEPDEAPVVRPALLRLLDGLAATVDPDPPADAAGAWRTWLLGALDDRPGQHTSGWRPKVAAVPDVDVVFRACEDRIDSLLGALPGRRDLVHSDLLHQNVLLDDAGEQVTAVFSWKCATWGDALYDTAWCTFWGRYHPGIGAIDVFEHQRRTAPADALVDAAERHHVYELQIGAHHLGWYATNGDDEHLHWTSRQLDDILEQGPRP